ncbi:MAG: hypothetical protein RL215_3256 [Planctomycetota bacterium]|jgi:hypothetical protein
MPPLTGLHLLITLAALLSLPPAPASAQTPIRFATGKNLEKALAESITCSALRMPLKRQLLDLQQESSICILRDRRIDPNTPITLRSGFITRRNLLAQFASTLPNSAAAFTDHYVCIAPSAAALRLPLLIQLAEQQTNPWKRLPPAVSRRALNPAPAAWTQAQTPADILSKAARNAGVAISNLEQLPHDVWDAAQLPSLPFIELACLILNQFDLFPQPNPETLEIQLAPIPNESPLELRHPFPPEFRNPLELAWNNAHPDVPVRWTRSSATLTATLPQHIRFAANLQQLHASLPGQNPQNNGSLKTRQFQLQAERATLGNVVASLRANGVTIEIPDESTPALQKLLQTIVPISAQPQNGEVFFNSLFADHFRSVSVLDDKVILRK